MECYSRAEKRSWSVDGTDTAVRTFCSKLKQKKEDRERKELKEAKVLLVKEKLIQLGYIETLEVSLTRALLKQVRIDQNFTTIFRNDDWPSSKDDQIAQLYRKMSDTSLDNLWNPKL